MERHRVGDATGARSGPLAKIAVYYTAHLARRANRPPLHFPVIAPTSPPEPSTGHAGLDRSASFAVGMPLFRGRVMLGNGLRADTLAGGLLDDRRNVLVRFPGLSVLLDLVAHHPDERLDREHLLRQAQGRSQRLLCRDGLVEGEAVVLCHVVPPVRLREPLPALLGSAALGQPPNRIFSTCTSFWYRMRMEVSYGPQHVDLARGSFRAVHR